MKNPTDIDAIRQQLIQCAHELRTQSLSPHQAADRIDQAAASLAKLDEHEEFYRTLINTLPVGVIMADARGKITYISPKAHEIYAVPPGGAIGTDPLDWVAPEYQDLVAQRLRRLLAEAAPQPPISYVMLRHDRTPFWAEIASSPVLDSQRRLIGVVTVAQDITNRKRAEDSARQAQLKFKRLVEGNIIGVIVADAHRVTEANDIFLAMIGYTRQEMEAGLIRWRDLTPPQHIPTDDRAVAQLMQHGVTTPFEKEYIARDGRLIPILMGAALLEREPFLTICFVIDLTERKRIDTALRELNESLESRVNQRSAEVRTLLLELEHRVKNNLYGLLSLVDAMRDRAPSVEVFASAIESRLHAMARVHDLLAQSSWRPLELHHLIKSVLGAASDLAHPIPVHTGGPQIVVRSDRVLPLALALVEWLTNSSKYGAHSTPTGQLHISWERLPGTPLVRLTWKESGGPPIPGPVTPSLGMSLVQGLASRELRGQCQMTFPPTGASHTLDFAAE